MSLVSSGPVSGFASFLMDAARLVPDKAFGRVLKPDDDWYRASVVDEALGAADRKGR